MLPKPFFLGLLLTSISLNAFALTETAGNFTFTYTVSDNEVTITSVSGRERTTLFTVPATLGGYPVACLAITGWSGGSSSLFVWSDVTAFDIPSTVLSIKNYPAYYRDSEWYKHRPSGCVYLGKVLVEYNGTLPSNISLLDGTLSIAEFVFSSQPSITTVNLPQSLKCIGANAFKGCTGLFSINMPNDLEIISGSAFYGCSRLLSLELPSNLKKLSSSAFYGCSALTNDLIIPNSVTEIGSSAFYGCSLLRSVKISDSVTTLSSSAFYGCTSLSLVEIGTNVAVIEGSAFYNCANLSFISLPASVASIASSAFSNCAKLKQVYCFPSVAPGDTGNIFTSSPQIHVLSSASGYTTPTWRGGTIIKDLENCPLVSFDSQGGSNISPQYFPVGNTYGTLPQPLKNGYLFLGWHTQPMGAGQRIKDTSVVPPGSSQTLYALWGRSETVDTYTYIYFVIEGKSTIFNADAAAITPLPDGALTVPATLGGCPVTVLRENAFSSCAALTSVELPSSITHIGSNVFYMCQTLNSVRFLGSAPAVCENVFTGTPTTLTTYVMPETLGWDGTPTSSLLPALWPAGTSGRNISTYGVNCTVTFISQGDGVDPASKTVTSGSLYGELPDATRSGYTFSGWWTTTNATSTQITPSSYVSPATNHALYAKWSANTYNVIFISPSGTVSPSSINVTYGLPYGALPTPTWSGYTLLGWSLEQASSDNSVVSTSIVSTASNHSLYAVWTNKAFTVTLNAQGGTVTPSSYTVYYNMPYGELPAPARANYVFDGWWTGVNGTETKITASSLYLSLSNKTLYAKWLSQYAIIFDSQGGVVSPTTKTVACYQPYGALPEPSFADAVFLNWWTQPNARGQIVTCDSNVTSTTAHTLYAQWDINSVVESSGLSWKTDGNTFWYPQTKTVKNSLLAMRSGTISHNQSTWIEATVNGPCRLRYWWNISSETSYDYLCCKTNNEEQARISGFNTENQQQSVGWTQQTLELPAGTNTVRWTYTKDFADTCGYDTAWLDNITLARGISVIFDPQGGSCMTTQKTVYVYELYDDLPFPVKAGNEFSGWWLDADGSGTEVTPNTVVNGKTSHTLYAKWTPLVTTSTPVPVPFSWLDLYFPLEVENHEEKAYQIGANGLPIWGSYVAGLIPTNANSLFIAHINLSNDTTYVTWTPNLGSERIYCVEGKTNLTDAGWSTTNAASRFFRVKVSLP